MKTLVIPDVHENIRGVERIQAQAGPVDYTVFTGDWFDPKGLWITSFTDTLKYLQQHGADADKTFLLGNHDVAYLTGRYWSCGGDPKRAERISKETFSRFKLTTEVQGWTLSHAGFTSIADVALAGEALAAVQQGERHPLLRIGWARGGHDRVLGGCVWLDWNIEFQPVEGLQQIVGHTIDQTPRWKGQNLCLDTQLRNFAIIEDGRVTVHDVKVSKEDLEAVRKMRRQWKLWEG